MENLVRDIRVSLAAGMRVCLPGLGVFTVERQPASVRSGAVYPPEPRTVFMPEDIDNQSDSVNSTTTPAQDALAQEIHRQTAAGPHFRIAGWGTFVRDAQTARYVLEDAREDLLAFPVVQLPEVPDEVEVMFEPVFAGSPETEIAPSESVRQEPSQAESSPSESVHQEPSQAEASRQEPSQAEAPQPAASPSASSPVMEAAPAPVGRPLTRPSFGHTASVRRRRKRRSPWLLLPGLLLLLAVMAVTAYFAYTYFNPLNRSASPVSQASGGAATVPSPAPVPAAPMTTPSAVSSAANQTETVPVAQPDAPAVPPAVSDALEPVPVPPTPSVAEEPQDTEDITPDLTVYDPENTVRYYVVVGSLTSESQAVSQIQAMSRAGGRNLRIVRFDTSLYRLVAGGCATYAEASALLEEVRAYAPKAWIFQRR